MHRAHGVIVHARMMCRETGRPMRDDTGARNGQRQIALAGNAKIETSGITERPSDTQQSMKTSSANAVERRATQIKSVDTGGSRVTCVVPMAIFGRCAITTVTEDVSLTET